MGGDHHPAFVLLTPGDGSEVPVFLAFHWDQSRKSENTRPPLLGSGAGPLGLADSGHEGVRETRLFHRG